MLKNQVPLPTIASSCTDTSETLSLASSGQSPGKARLERRAGLPKSPAKFHISTPDEDRPLCCGMNQAVCVDSLFCPAVFIRSNVIGLLRIASRYVYDSTCGIDDLGLLGTESSRWSNSLCCLFPDVYESEHARLFVARKQEAACC